MWHLLDLSSADGRARGSAKVDQVMANHKVVEERASTQDAEPYTLEYGTRTNVGGGGLYNRWKIYRVMYSLYDTCTYISLVALNFHPIY